MERLSGILQLKIFWKRNKNQNLKKWRWKCEVAKHCNFDNKNLNPPWSWKCSFYFDLVRDLLRYKRGWEYVRGFYCL